jgi:hypothetical protein
MAQRCGCGGGAAAPPLAGGLMHAGRQRAHRRFGPAGGVSGFVAIGLSGSGIG